jgi:hypothetical protein
MFFRLSAPLTCEPARFVNNGTRALVNVIISNKISYVKLVLEAIPHFFKFRLHCSHSVYDGAGASLSVLLPWLLLLATSVVINSIIFQLLDVHICPDFLHCHRGQLGHHILRVASHRPYIFVLEGSLSSLPQGRVKGLSVYGVTGRSHKGVCVSTVISLSPSSYCRL